jgi:membrane-associated phospholipid phosphatase
VEVIFVALAMLFTRENKHYQMAVAFSTILCLLVGIFIYTYGKNESFLIINKYNSPEFDYVFRFWTYLGDGVIWVPLFIYILVWKRDFFLTALVALIICTILTHLLKRVIYPEEFRPIVVLKEQVRIIEGLHINRANSFPSGHTSTAFTLALLLAFLVRKGYAAFFFPLVAFFVGYSRVYLAQHFVTDVFAGMIVGIISSYLALIAYEYYKLKRLKRVK